MDKKFNYTETRYVVISTDQTGRDNWDCTFSLANLGSLVHTLARLNSKIVSVIAQRWQFESQKWESID